MKKNSLIRKYIRDNGNDGWTAFDFKSQDIIFYDKGLVCIKQKTRSQRKRRKAVVQDELKFEAPACVFWFGALDEIIDYLQNTKRFLNKLGYDTSGSIEDRPGDVLKRTVQKVYKE